MNEARGVVGLGLLPNAVLGRVSASALIPISTGGSEEGSGAVSGSVRLVRFPLTRGDVEESGGFKPSPPIGSAGKILEILDTPRPDGFSLAVEDGTVGDGSLSASPDALRAFDPSTESSIDIGWMEACSSGFPGVTLWNVP